MTRKPRIATKAIIIRDNTLLTLHLHDERGDYYLLPGGGQERGETLHAGLQRECLEEIGVPVEIGPLRFVLEHIQQRETDDIHQVDLCFFCTIAPDAVPGMGIVPDTNQIGVAWLPIDQIRNYLLYPRLVRDRLGTDAMETAPVYLGVV